MKKLYSLFHLNTSFSSVEKKDQKKLLKKCYWPLLNIIEDNDFKIAIELGGKTLQEINSLDKKWVLKFKNLLDEKKCELIGSGFSQIIGPIVPVEITKKNLEIGNQIYKKILNRFPKIGLVNEQAFSSSMIKIYNKFYNAIIIDWINAKANVDEKFLQNDSEPAFLKDDHQNKIKVIWSNSIAFQKFQRVIFGEINLKNFIDYIDSSKKNNYCCIYSNDAEIFNFRAKRFGSESKIVFNEWKKVEEIFKFLSSQQKYKFINFSTMLKNGKNKSYKVTNCTTPIIVKKQAKYNINRWSVCGKDNLLLNTFCWKIYEYLKKNNNQKLWRTLCELWGSDYRTHTTNKKWFECKTKLKKIIKKYKIKKLVNKIKFRKIKDIKRIKEISINNNLITFNNKNFLVSFNFKKGLVINEFIDKGVSQKSLLGTIVQGEIKNYGSSSDFFSGNNSILKKKNLSRFSDLLPCTFQVYSYKKIFLLSTKIKDKNSKIVIEKNIFIDLNKRYFKIQINLNNVPDSIVRLFKMTINPLAFNQKQLTVKTHNGGQELESFSIKDDFNHGASIENVSNYTSSNTSFSMTKGKIIIGDKKRSLVFEVNKSLSALVAMLEFSKLKSKYFLRLFFSAYESDDTSNFIYNKNFSSSVLIKAQKKPITLFK
tara:strand:+ start:181 stop:2133 length:1953 start_codon:yes stop_codon:yes gene_type:complete